MIGFITTLIFLVCGFISFGKGDQHTGFLFFFVSSLFYIGWCITYASTKLKEAKESLTTAILTAISVCTKEENK